MEKNYKWKVTKGRDKTTENFGWTETMGQSLVLIKHEGIALDKKGEQPKNYRWRITDFTDPERPGDIDVVEGSYDVNFFPLIEEINEYE